jgi:V/A-type H+-transporting ATPase subunit B
MKEAIERGGKEIVGVSRINGPLIFVKDVGDASYDEVVEVVDEQGDIRQGRVLEVGVGTAVIEVFAGTTGLSIQGTRIRFMDQPLRIALTDEMLGRVFDGMGRTIDGGPEPLAERFADINGKPINPSARIYPRDTIQTGISVIDGMNTLVLGQKLPIFSGSGLPHVELAAQIVRQARLANDAPTDAMSSNPFAIVFAGMGIKHDVANYFRHAFTESGALTRVAMFLNLADDPAIERLITPRAALTLAEYLAFEREMHVLVILIDMTNYCEALRQISSTRGEVPSRKGYPGYMYSDLASIYERTGRIKDHQGSITQLPILTMPNDDITHPVPDLVGYITEGQIVLARDLHQRGVYPPIHVLPSLSRLMKDGIGKGSTRSDHAHLAAQLYAAYAHVQDTRALATVIGEQELSRLDQRYLKFGQAFEQEFVNQSQSANRSIQETLDTGWHVLSILPKEELVRLTEDEISEHYQQREE